MRTGFLPMWLAIQLKKGLPTIKAMANIDRTPPAAVLLYPYTWIRYGPPHRPPNANAIPTAKKRFKKEKLSEELADVYYYLLLLANESGINLKEAFKSKMKINEKKNPKYQKIPKSNNSDGNKIKRLYTGIRNVKNNESEKIIPKKIIFR